MINVFCGFGALVVGAVIYWIVCCIRSTKDPNVQNAAKLKMPINRYLLYKKLYDEYFDFMMEHGANSIASEQKFIEIFKQIKYPNEWRRYEEYRASNNSISQMIRDY